MLGPKNKVVGNSFKHVIGQETGPQTPGTLRKFDTAARSCFKFSVCRVENDSQLRGADALGHQAIALGLDMDLRLFET